MPFRNALDVVQRIAAEFPPQGRPLEFTKRVAWTLHQEDQGWGLNGKRGTDALSIDCVHYRGPDRPMQIVDILRAADAEAVPQWLEHEGIANVGKWIPPEPVGVPVPPPIRPPVPPAPPSSGVEVQLGRLADALASIAVSLERVANRFA